MTQGKKKKRAANRSIMLAKKIIIKDGGTVSAGSAPQGGPGAGPASSSPRFRLRWAGSALPARAAGAARAAEVSACGLRGLAPLEAARTCGRALRLRSLRPRPTCARPRGGGVGPSAASPGPARRAGRLGSLALRMLWRVAAAAARWARVRALSHRGHREPGQRL